MSDLDSNVKNNNNNKSNKTIIVIVIGFTIIIAVLVAGIILLMNRQAAPPTVVQQSNSMGSGSVMIDESNLETAMEDLNATVEEGMFTTEMNTVWSFPNSISPSEDAYFANAASNNSSIYFEIIMPDGDVVFKSSLIPPGSKIKEIILQKAVEPGSHEVSCLIHLLDNAGEEKSTVSLAVSMTVLG